MKDTVNKLMLGVLGPAAGYGGTMLTAEESLKILSLVIGISVGIASFISICFSIRRKWKNYRNEKINPKDASLDDAPTTTI